MCVIVSFYESERQLSSASYDSSEGVNGVIKPGFHMSGKSQTNGDFTFCRPSQICRYIG